MLSIMCVSSMKARTKPFIEELENVAKYIGAEFVLVRDGIDVKSAGYIESVMDQATAMTLGEYVLRIDDDEKLSSAAVMWLKQREYKRHDAWAFPRVALWPDTNTMIAGFPKLTLFPDFQLRLLTRNYPWPNELHRVPHVACQLAPVMIEHHSFLCKTYEERRALTAEYEAIKTGQPCAVADVDKVMPEDWGTPELMPYDGDYSWCWSTEKLP